MVMPYHLHMPSYFLETFTEYPYRFFYLSTTTIPAAFSDKEVRRIVIMHPLLACKFVGKENR